MSGPWIEVTIDDRRRLVNFGMVRRVDHYPDRGVSYLYYADGRIDNVAESHDELRDKLTEAGVTV